MAKWIQKAIKHRGSLTAYAKKHKAYANGKIIYSKLPKKMTTHRKRQVAFAKRLWGIK